MGMYGSVVIHPVRGRAPGRKRLDTVARDILRAFERAALLPRGTADAAHCSPATSVVGGEELPPDVAGVSIGVDGPVFRPSIADLVFAWTWAEYNDGVDLELPEGVTADQFVFPILTVAVYSKAVRATHFDGDLAFRSWAMIEFSFEDVRVNLDEVHRIRDEEHPLFRELAAALKTEVGWSVVMY